MEIRNLNNSVTPLTPTASTEAIRTATPESGNVDVRQTSQAVARAAEARAQQEQAREELTPRDLQESVNRVNEAVKVFNSSVRFSIDEETQQRVVRVVDLETDEVIRQIPSEEVLAIARAFDKLQGLLLKDKA